jgi:drug/metabolite transporter (DMT)-like permease
VALITGLDIMKGAGHRVLLGDFLAFISAISYAGIILWTRKAMLMKLDIISFVFWGWAITAIFCFPFALGLGNLSLSFYPLLALVGLSIFSTVLPFIISNVAIKDLSAQASSIIAFSEAVFVMLWGALLYKEAVTAITLLGSGLIFMALVVMAQAETKKLDIAE